MWTWLREQDWRGSPCDGHVQLFSCLWARWLFAFSFKPALWGSFSIFQAFAWTFLFTAWTERGIKVAPTTKKTPLHGNHELKQKQYTRSSQNNGGIFVRAIRTCEHTMERPRCRCSWIIIKTGVRAAVTKSTVTKTKWKTTHARRKQHETERNKWTPLPKKKMRCLPPGGNAISGCQRRGHCFAMQGQGKSSTIAPVV